MFFQISRFFCAGIALFFSCSIFAGDASVKFSSLYFDHNKDCHCLEKNLQDGQDCTNFSCRDILGYHITMSFDGSACDSGIVKVSKGKQFNISLDYVPAKLEFRLADGNPFAIIYRRKEGYREYCINGIDNPTKKPLEFLYAKGLDGFSRFEAKVSSKEKNANAEIRTITDGYYKKQK